MYIYINSENEYRPFPPVNALNRASTLERESTLRRHGDDVDQEAVRIFCLISIIGFSLVWFDTSPTGVFCPSGGLG